MRNSPPPLKIAQALVLTGFTASVMLAAPAQAADCSKTTTVSVPYNWSITQRGSKTATVEAFNKAFNSTVSGTGEPSFNVSYTVKLDFIPLTSYCSQLTPTPTKNILAVTGGFTGILKTTFINIGIPNVIGPDTTFAHADALISISDNKFPDFKEYNLKSPTETNFNDVKSESVSVGVGSVVGVSGSVNTYAATGPTSLPSLNPSSFASASVFATAKLTGENSGTVNYTVPVPWETDALSVIGSTVLFGLGIWGKCKLTQKQINNEEKNKDA